jgi:hypothetical protein
MAKVATVVVWLPMKGVFRTLPSIILPIWLFTPEERLPVFGTPVLKNCGG